MSTDSEWEQWGVRDPYYGVITHPKFRASALTTEAKREFFESGSVHIGYVLGTCRSRLDPAFAPDRVLDFGCGVGRLLIPFAQVAREVCGMDVSPSMLAEARLNCEERGISNVALVMSDDLLSQAEGQFDLVHSCIVLQHIEVVRGRELFRQLVGKVRAGGCGVIQVTYGWDAHASTFGFPPPVLIPAPPATDALSSAKASVRTFFASLLGQSQGSSTNLPNAAELQTEERRDPEMQMNYYSVNELMFILQIAGVKKLHCEFTDHGGALGLFLFFQMPDLV